MIAGFIPTFDAHRVFFEPWTDGLADYRWIMLMGFLVTAACGLVGNYLILRRMALVGDAISHSVLPGLAIAFIISNSRASFPMFLGALAAGLVTAVLIEVIHRNSRVKQDAAIGISFSTLFAIGVILISVFADKVDLDQECVLFGEIAFVPQKEMLEIGGIAIAPVPVVRMGAMLILVVALILLFYKELLVSSFDPGLAASMGIRSNVVHYSLMGVLSLVVVSAFDSAGAILVVAMLILPGATASLLARRLPTMLGLSVIHSALSSVLGLHLALWLDCSIAAAMVVAGASLFFAAWTFHPREGLLRRFLSPRTDLAPPELDVLDPSKGH